MIHRFKKNNGGYYDFSPEEIINGFNKGVVSLPFFRLQLSRDDEMLFRVVLAIEAFIVFTALSSNHIRDHLHRGILLLRSPGVTG